MVITRLKWWAGSVLLAALVLGAAVPAGAQEGTEFRGDSPLTPVTQDVNEVAIKVRRMGAGDRIRIGEWTAFLVEVTDSAKPRTVFVQLEMPDADGDTVLARASTVTNPDQPRPVWLYVWHPRMSVASHIYKFAVYEVREKSDAEGRSGLDRYTPVRLIGKLSYPGPQRSAIDPTAGLIGIIGTATAGLEQYATCRDNRGQSPTGHEVTDVVAGMAPADIPERWHGLMQYETLVWTGTGGEYEPSDISEPQAAAIKGWVRRGGQLVILMPPVGQLWYGSTAGVNPLADIMPVVRPELMEGGGLEPYRWMLTNEREVSLPSSGVATHRLRPASEAGPYDAMTILSGPQGEEVVVRRLVGAGAVTLVGLDLTRRDLAARNALQAHVFWNRLLGKRLELLSQTDINAWQSGKGPKGQTQVRYVTDRSQIVEFDSVIAERIGKRVSAAAGLLMAFVVFLAYWLLAGPIAQMVLKARGRRQYAWLAFVAVSGVFTVIGWGGSNLLKLRRDVDKHFTLVDHVYGQSNQRLRSWVELTLPNYGDQMVSVADPSAAAGSDWNNTLAAWQPPGNAGAFASFPDARGYPIDSRAPDSVEFPARATTRQLQIDYAGSVPPTWGMPRPVPPVEGDPPPLGREIWIEDVPDSARLRDQPNWKINGILTHSLPAPLTDVAVIVVRGQDRYRRAPGELLAVTAASFINEWKPGAPLDLAAEFGTLKNASAGAFPQFLENVRGRPASGFANFGVAATREAVDFDRAVRGITFFSLLPPPEPTAQAAVRVQREATHGWDISRWVTQPCVIIVGTLGAEVDKPVECPIPISIDGEPGEIGRKRVMGATVIRWMYPLKPSPPSLMSPAPVEETEPLDAPLDRRPGDGASNDPARGNPSAEDPNTVPAAFAAPPSG